MKPNNIFIIRHGESVGNVNEEIYKTVPDWRVELTDKGKQQALEAAQKLLITTNELTFKFYISPWIRTRQTAEIIINTLKENNRKVFHQEDPRLREQEWGNYNEDALSLKIEKERAKFGRFYYRMPHGESGSDTYDRISTFLETLHRDFKKEDFPSNAVIITHGLTSLIFVMRWFHLSPEEFDSLKTPKNCEIIALKKVSEDGPHNNYVMVNALRKRL